jgi:transcriptional regulator with XRE-family HTH domain
MHTRISEIVRNSGLTKTEFGKRINISQSMASRICAGDANPSDRTISDICREFGCNEVWLRTGEGEPFHQRTREEEIMRFAVRAARGSEGFRKQLAFMLSQLDEEDWENLEKIYQKQLDKIKNSDRG